MRANYHIILADDYVRFREEIKKIINQIPGVEIMAEVGEGEELFKLLGTFRPDLILLDISMPNLRGMKATQTIKSNYPEVKVILMIMDGEKEYRSYAMAAGADGILLKGNSATELRTAIRKIRNGKQYFPRFHETEKFGGNIKKYSFIGFGPHVFFC